MAKTIRFYWHPSHICIQGNDLADQAAKDAVNDDALYLPVPYTALRRHINAFIRYKWQSLWDETHDNKLHIIQSSLGRWPGRMCNHVILTESK